MNLNMPSNPFVGLRPFEAEDSLLFFGRHEQTLELLQQLHETHFLAVVGSSGSGKSSLVRAGLIPKLQGGFLVEDRDLWHIARMKPGDAPLHNLASTLVGALTEKENPQQEAEFTEAIREQGMKAVIDKLKPFLLKNESNLLLLVDQFEEIFRFGLHSAKNKQSEDTSDFVAIMLNLAEQRDLPIYVTMTMRSDFLGDCDAFLGLPEAINRSQYLVPRLTRQQRREAIEGPIRLYDGTIAARLTDRLLNETIDARDDLPVLQHALMRTWNFSQQNGGRTIDNEHYEAIGTIYETMSQHAEEALKGLDERNLLLTKRLFQALTETDTANRRIRRPAKLYDVAVRTDENPDKIWQIVERFRTDGRSFLVVSNEYPQDNPLIDISHESLIRQWSRLKEWVDEEAKSVKTYIRLAETALLHQEGKAGYYRNPDLQVALEWQQQDQPNKTWALGYHEAYTNAMTFLQKSQQEQDAEITSKEKHRRKELKRNRIFSAALAIALIIAVYFAWEAFKQTKVAEMLAYDAIEIANLETQLRITADSNAVVARDALLKNEQQAQQIVMINQRLKELVEEKRRAEIPIVSYNEIIKRRPDFLLHNQFQSTFPELASWGVVEVYREEEMNIAMNFLAVPLWFAETFIINHQNAKAYLQLRDKLHLADSLNQSIITLQDRIIILETSSRKAFEEGYNTAILKYDSLSDKYIKLLKERR